VSRSLHDCELEVLPGLEPFAEDELRERCGAHAVLARGQPPGALRFRLAGDLARLLGFRSATAAYLVRRFDAPRPRALLGNQQLGALEAVLKTALALWPPGTFRTLRLSAAGEDSSVMARLRDELARRAGLEPTPGDGDMLVRVRPARSGGWEVLVRLSPRPLSTRPWRVCNLPGALNAAVAHVMMRLTGPRPGDRVLNLACGSGTLLIERLALGPAAWAAGCDTDPAALACARENLAAAGFAGAARLEAWDAGALPLADGSVDVLCADLPFGQLVGSHAANETLYPRLLAEAGRVAATEARMVLVTHELRLLDRVMARQSGIWRLVRHFRVRVSGMTPGVYLLERCKGTQVSCDGGA
jgi:predicted RNA methylase